MGFGRKTPKPGKPIRIDPYHRHKYFDKRKNRWVEVRCHCDTGKFHVTPKDDT